VIGWAIVAGGLFILVLTLALCKVSAESSAAAVEYKPAMEETTIHPPEPTTEYAYMDAYLLAKIMQAEAGVDWPDWAVMCIGEVVLNRVASSDFPDTIHDVLHQVDPVQYEPVHTGAWESMEPDEDYIDLARRLLDGERVLNNPDVVWQALFPQGERTVMTYHDKVLNTTTYFCE